MKRRLVLWAAAVLTTVTLGVSTAQAAFCITGTGWICGGVGMCCVAGETWCFVWECDY